MRVVLTLVACVPLAGCNPMFSSDRDPAGWTPPCVPGTEPAPVRACDAPSDPSPDDVVDVHTFRVLASAAVCDWSLRCGIGIAAYCHRRYAEWEADRSEPAGFDLAAARACVRAIEEGGCDDALYAVIACHEISLHGVCRDCPLDCGGCAAREGDACDARASTCDLDLVCGVSGTCERAPLLVCAEGPVAPTGHFGCPCTRDDECPDTTGACVGGLCRPRPFAGDPCGAGEGACFESICDAGRCRPFDVGEGPCGGDASCAPGLLCGTSPALFRPGSWRCGVPIPVGAPCGPTAPGRCADGLRCRDDLVCVPGG